MIAIIDIDNCIADDRHRRHLIDMSKPHPDDRYKAYHDVAHMDEPCNHDIVERHLEYGDQLAFVTARPQRYKRQTLDWLEGNFNIPPSSLLLMRPSGNHEPSHVLKPQLVMAHFDTDEVGVAYDDRQEVLNAYKEIGIKEVRLVNIDGDRPSDILRQAAATFEQRNALYGDSYKSYGNVMVALFPNGLKVNTADDWNRLGVLNMIVSKLTRYAANMEAGGHKDSAHDTIVYAAMLEELTDENGSP